MQTDTSVYLNVEGQEDQPSQHTETAASKDSLPSSTIKTGDGLFVCCLFLSVLLVCICILVVAVKRSQASLNSKKGDSYVWKRYK